MIVLKSLIFLSIILILFSKLMEEFCTKLYDTLRPIIIHVIHIETLAELCSILKNEILLDNVKNNGNGVCLKLNYFKNSNLIKPRNYKFSNKFVHNCWKIFKNDLFIGRIFT
jgi:hypothetical protein